VRALIESDPRDVVLDGHFLYPDGVAVALLGTRLGVPTVLTARGSDVNVKCDNPVMLRWVRAAAANSAAVITVSRALADRLAQLRISAPLVEVLPNGVDLEKFRPLDRVACRDRFGVDGVVLASVGHLIEDKGHRIAIEAIADRPGTTLLLVGEGPERAALQHLATELGLQARVRFLGLVPHERMAEVYTAADALVLPSLREGMPNVLLESLACGTPVVATGVGGVAEIIKAPFGYLMRGRSVGALVEALDQLFSQRPTVEQTRAFAERFGWTATVAKQLRLYERVLELPANTHTWGAH
jgi:glycosyltransferase involved in cell wall biosynthesis